MNKQALNLSAIANNLGVVLSDLIDNEILKRAMGIICET